MTLRKNKVEALTPDEMDENFEELEKKSNMMLGVGQTWQDVIADREDGVIYTNNTGKPISLNIEGWANGSYEFNLFIDDMQLTCGQKDSRVILNQTIPNNSTYKLDYSGANIDYWLELR
jgi:hypothetical protein